MPTSMIFFFFFSFVAEGFFLEKEIWERTQRKKFKGTDCYSQMQQCRIDLLQSAVKKGPIFIFISID